MNVSTTLLLLVTSVTNGVIGHGSATAAATLEKAALDKYWTTNPSVQEAASQILMELAVPTHQVFQAERTGFEPAVGFDPYICLANRRFRPLSHLSRRHECKPAIAARAM